MPDQLLDTVKEEQNRAREANRTARGGAGGGGGGGRGGAYLEIMCSSSDVLMALPFQVVVSQLAVRISLPFRTTGDRVLIVLYAGRGGRGGPIRGGPGGGRGRGRGQ